MRILYRIHQFWHTLSLRIDPDQQQQAYRYLTPVQCELFDRLQTSEKIHALTMLAALLSQGETEPDLLVAALLHDLGKLKYPLSSFERVIIVVAKAFMPGRAKRWGTLPPGGLESSPRWRKAFILAQHHAEWGADMALRAGASPLTVELIREHHDPPPGNAKKEVHRLKQALWLVDNES